MTGGLIKGNLDRDTHWLFVPQDEGGAAPPITAVAGTALQYLGGRQEGPELKPPSLGSRPGLLKGWGKRECLACLHLQEWVCEPLVHVGVPGSLGRYRMNGLHNLVFIYVAAWNSFVFSGLNATKI